MESAKMIDGSFEVKFTIPQEVRSYNDAVINEALVIAAAKEAARSEILRQLSESVANGDFDVSK